MFGSKYRIPVGAIHESPLQVNERCSNLPYVPEKQFRYYTKLRGEWPGLHLLKADAQQQQVMLGGGIAFAPLVG